MAVDQNSGEERHLVSGMPIINAFFTDLNGDGFPELCATAAEGSGIVDTHIIVCDLHNGKSYQLCERPLYDYCLILKDGALFVQKTDIWDYEVTPMNGKLAIQGDELVFAEQ